MDYKDRIKELTNEMVKIQEEQKRLADEENIKYITSIKDNVTARLENQYFRVKNEYIKVKSIEIIKDIEYYVLITCDSITFNNNKHEKRENQTLKIADRYSRDYMLKEFIPISESKYKESEVFLGNIEFEIRNFNKQ